MTSHPAPLSQDALIPTIIIPSMNPVLCQLSASFIPPGWPVIVKDGNPLKHFAELKTLDIQTRWAINVDEDCFLINPQAILDLIARMEREGYDTAAVQDGATHMRFHNPVLFNPYFFIFDVAKVQAAPSTPDLDPAAESRKFAHLVRYAELPYDYDGFESYYPFFVDLLRAGLRPLFLNDVCYDAFRPRDFDLGKPSIVVGDDGRQLAIHSWWSRMWHLPVLRDRIRICTEYAMYDPGCLRHAERDDEQKRVLGLVTLQHNRGPQLRAWMEFHYAQGFRKFYFYADRCTDNTFSVLQELSATMDISVFNLAEAIPQAQLTVQQHAITTHLPHVDWMAFVDAGQYLHPQAPVSLQQALLPYQYEPLSGLAVYAQPAQPGAAGVTTLLRGKLQVRVTSQPQLFITEQGTFDEQGRPVSPEALASYQPSYQFFQLSSQPPRRTA